MTGGGSDWAREKARKARARPSSTSACASAVLCLAVLLGCREDPREPAMSAPRARLSASSNAPSSPLARPDDDAPASAPADRAGLCNAMAVPSFGVRIVEGDGRPLCGATVIMEGNGQWWQVRAAMEPTVPCPYISAGNFRISASRPGFLPATTTIAVTSGRCHPNTVAVKLTLRRRRGAPPAEPCPDPPPELGRFSNLPDEGPIAYVTSVRTEGLGPLEARRLAARQPRFQACWEQHLPSGERAPFYLSFVAQVLLTGQLAAVRSLKDDPPQAPDGLRACIERVLESREVAAPAAGAGKLELWVGFR